MEKHQSKCHRKDNQLSQEKFHQLLKLQGDKYGSCEHRAVIDKTGRFFKMTDFFEDQAMWENNTARKKSCHPQINIPAIACRHIFVTSFPL